MNREEKDLSHAVVEPFEIRPTIDDSTQSQRVRVTSYGVNDVKSAETKLSRWKNSTYGIDDGHFTVTVYVDGIQIVSVFLTDGEEQLKDLFVRVLELVGQKSCCKRIHILPAASIDVNNLIKRKGTSSKSAVDEN